MTWITYGGSRQSAMESEPNQQPNDNSTRQADSIGSEDLDAAILAAVQRANDVHSADDQQMFALTGDLISPLEQYFGYGFKCVFSESLRRGHTSIAISPDSQTLVCGGQDKTLRLWNLHTGKRLRTLRGHSEPITSVAISPDGQTVVSGSEDGSIKWNLHTGEELHTWKGDSKRLLSLAISPDGQTVVSGSEDGSIKIWNLHTKEELHTLEHLGRLYAVAVSPDGQTVVSAGGSITIWNLQTGEHLHTI